MTDLQTEALRDDYHSPNCPPPFANPTPPSFAVPLNACDSHCHIFGPRHKFPYSPTRTFTPVDAPKEAIESVHRHLGLTRTVAVQSSCSGNDHSALIDALEASNGQMRGVALIDEQTTPAEVARLHEAGVRGYRLNFLPHLRTAPTEDEVATAAQLVAPYGWHTEIHISGHEAAEHESFIASIKGPVVIDHLGRVNLDEGLDSPSVEAILRLLDRGNIWIKISGVDRASNVGAPYADAVALAAKYVEHAPERVLWGTDYPHVNITGSAPDDGLLLNLLPEIAPSREYRELILVSNPAEFFDF